MLDETVLSRAMIHRPRKRHRSLQSRTSQLCSATPEYCLANHTIGGSRASSCLLFEYSCLPGWQNAERNIRATSSTSTLCSLYWDTARGRTAQVTSSSFLSEYSCSIFLTVSSAGRA